MTKTWAQPFQNCWDRMKMKSHEMPNHAVFSSSKPGMIDAGRLDRGTQTHSLGTQASTCQGARGSPPSRSRLVEVRCAFVTGIGCRAAITCKLPGGADGLFWLPIFIAFWVAQISSFPSPGRDASNVNQMENCHGLWRSGAGLTGRISISTTADDDDLTSCWRTPRTPKVEKQRKHGSCGTP